MILLFNNHILTPRKMAKEENDGPRQKKNATWKVDQVAVSRHAHAQGYHVTPWDIRLKQDFVLNYGEECEASTSAHTLCVIERRVITAKI